MVRSHLDYCSSVGVPYKKGDIELLEKVQKRATKLIPAIKTITTLNALKLVNYQHCITDILEEI